VHGKILVGFDDSEAAGRALDRALEEARSAHARLVVLAVAEMPLDPDQPRNFGTLDDISPGEGAALGAPPQVVSALADARKRVEAAGSRAEYRWSAGDPARSILDAATSVGAGLIVLGEHHHGFLGSLFGEDVAAEVKKHAGCDVLVA
jgi:nucleotide-binding universal stress UspA family protein